ncbi:hypothetical protein Hanom_Chr12g01109111 [Helianthus anomalus]
MNEHKSTQMNECSRTPYRAFTNTIERTSPLVMFVHLTNRTKFLVHVRSFNEHKRTSCRTVHELFVECSVRLRP